MTRISKNNAAENRSKHRSKGPLWNGSGTAFGTFQNTVPVWNGSGTIRIKRLTVYEKNRNGFGTIAKRANLRSTTLASLKRGKGWNDGTTAKEMDL